MKLSKPEDMDDVGQEQEQADVGSTLVNVEWEAEPIPVAEAVEGNASLVVDMFGADGRATAEVEQLREIVVEQREMIDELTEAVEGLSSILEESAGEGVELEKDLRDTSPVYDPTEEFEQ